MYSRNEPYQVEEEPGTKHYCACGKTGNAPYCDGSHQGTGKVPFEVEVKEKSTLYICGCGKSGTLPHCDGSHKG